MEKEKEGFPITSLREINTLLKVLSMDSSTKFQAPLPVDIFFDLVIRFITNRKYAFFCIF